MAENRNLIYIVGRGHSGSTLLAGLLGHADDVESVGELVYPMTKLCSCGQPFARCEFWQQVRVYFEQESSLGWEESMKLIQQQAHILQFPRTMTMRKSSSTVQEMIKINRSLAAAIGHVAGRGQILDASKQPARALFLIRHLPETKFIHIVRQPEEYLASYYYRIKQGGVNFFRREYRSGPLDIVFLAAVALSWTVANLAVELIRLRYPGRVVRVRYEDLCRNPKAELLRLQSFLKLDLSSVIKAVEQRETMRIGHIVGGNAHMRSGDGFVFEPKLGVRRPISGIHKIMVQLLSWPLMLLYKYSLFGSTDVLPSTVGTAVDSKTT